MIANNNIDKKIEDTINSFDGAQQAMPKPFLFTRVMARMNNVKENVWEKVGRFIARPTVAIVGLFLVLGINGMALFNNSNKTRATATEQANSTDEYSTAVATLYNFENGE